MKRTPFTIQLLYGSSGYKQVVSLGVDAGTKHIGLSATTEKQVLFEADVGLRTDIVKLLSTRREMRAARRSRKTRYRKARFLNRTRPKGWLAPSVQHKVDSHVKMMNKVYQILPIKRLTIEVAQFDTQLRDKHTCQRCKGKSTDKILTVHHKESRRTGGDSPANLITLCKTCHHYIHKHSLEESMIRTVPPLRDVTQMTIMRWFIYNGVQEHYPEVELTYGYKTKRTRIENKLQKSHRIDARCISGNPLATPLSTTYLYKHVRQNNRQLHKMTIAKGGYRKANNAEKSVKGFQLFDKVIYEGIECFVFGRRKTGYLDLRTLDGINVHKSASFKKLRVVEKASTLLVQIQKRKEVQACSSHD